MSKVEKVPTGSFSPFYGCTILIIGVLTFGGMVSWVLYSGYKQNQEIGLFTVDNPEPLPAPEISPEQKTSLQTKLRSFSELALLDKPTSLTLSVAELNVLVTLTAEAEVADYRGIVLFTGIDPKSKELLAKLHWPMNKLSLKEDAKRYLVGDGTFIPFVDKGALELRIENVFVPGKPVSEGFLNNLRQWPWLNLAKTKTEIADVLGKIKTIDFTPDGTALVLSTETPPAP